MLEELLVELKLNDIATEFNLIEGGKIDSIEFNELVELYYDDPIGFSEDVLGFYPDDKQKAIMRAVRDNKRISVRSGQGVGKTATCACLIIWFMVFRYEAKVICTAPTAAQLNTVLWPETAKWLQETLAEDYLSMTKTFIYRKGYEANWFANAKTSNRKERMLGLHADNMLIICDEAPGVQDDILETLMGTISGEDNKILLIGNPVRNSGMFFDSHHSMKDDFLCIHINAEDCSRTDQKNIDMLKRKYGENSNVVRCLVKGLFPLDEDDVFLQLPLVMQGVNLDISIPDEPSTIDIGVDVARFGSDLTALIPKIDMVVPEEFIVAYQGKDTMKTAGAALRMAKQFHIKWPKPAVVIKIDDTGVGGGVTDRLKEIKDEEGLDWLKVLPCKFGMPVKKGSQAYAFYYDTTTYMASVIRDLLNDDELKLPNNFDLIGQLTNRKYYIHNSKGQVKIESKDEMKKRGLSSPDLADALFLACLPVSLKIREWKGSAKR